MPGGKSPGPSIKSARVYEALKSKGYSKEKAAKISNAQAAKQDHPVGAIERRLRSSRRV